MDRPELAARLARFGTRRTAREVLGFAGSHGGLNGP
jgi:hypothetical protein